MNFLSQDLTTEQIINQRNYLILSVTYQRYQKKLKISKTSFIKPESKKLSLTTKVTPSEITYKFTKRSKTVSPGPKQ